MLPPDSDLIRLFGAATFERGQGYQRHGNVRDVHQAGPNTIFASVSGSRPHPYKCRITVQSDMSTSNVCTCALGGGCKHVVAALLEARRRGILQPGRTHRQPGHAPAGPAVPAPLVLAPQISAWVAELERAAVVPRENYETGAGQRLYYVFGMEAAANDVPALKLEFISVRHLKSGALSGTQNQFHPRSIEHGSPPKYLLASDHRILREYLRLGAFTALGHAAIEPDDGLHLLSQIIATGRARWGGLDGPVMTLGPAYPGSITWLGLDEGTLAPVLQMDHPNENTIRLVAQPPVYVEMDTGVLGPITFDIPPRLAFRAMNAPRLPIDQAMIVSERLARAGGALTQVAPPVLAPPRIVDETPLPILRLFRDTAPDPEEPKGYYFGQALIEIGRAQVLFRYGGVEVRAGQAKASVLRLDGLQPVEIRRRMPLEQAAMERLAEAGLLRLYTVFPGWRGKDRSALTLETAADWCEFLYGEAPVLREEGWAIEIAPDFPFQVIRADGPFMAEVTEGSGIDWFEFDLGTVVDGERVDLIGPLVSAIQTISGLGELLAALADEDGVMSLRIDDRRFLSIPARRLKPYVDTLLQLLSGFAFAEGSDKPRFSALDAAALAGLEETGEGLVWRGGESVRALGSRLRQTGGIPAVTLPDSFAATLRPYQARGLAWLDFLRSAGLGGILADDMGLGKTIQALALIACEKAAGRLTSPVLVIAPTSLMVNWEREAARFAPDLAVLTLQGLGRKERFGAIGDADLVLTTYPLIRHDHDVLKDRDWHMILLDEAQTIKNPAATTTKLVYGLKSAHRFCLTGTPMENHLGELWSLFRFIAPGFLGDARSFAKNWRAPIEKHGDAERSRMLSARVKPFLLRRRKDEVAAELPPKTEIIERVELSPAQSEIYESIRLAMHDKVYKALAEKGLARSRIVILEALLRLRQACCDPRLLKLGGPAAEKAGSAKLDRLMEMVEELHAEDRRMLIFSQFTSMLDLIRPRLEAAGIPHALLTGETKDRAAQVNAFQSGLVPVFLVSLKAGGVGLNLTAADTVILYDPWWNPAVENQAIDRAHRIGQDKPVFVHKLVASGTIEEKIEVLKERKAALAAGLFDAEGAPADAMTEDDLKALFAA